ncbi:MAG: hypothetical protein J0L93_07420 [Deltaproteobacteria bacterium]|nr:hypothetical protein [Deltaproteobacteria bacterium]
MKIEVKETTTQVAFKNSMVNLVTKRSIAIEIYEYSAFSEYGAPVPADITYDQVEKFSLNDDYLDETNGVEYQVQGYSDPKKRPYPVSFLRLKASVPEKNRVKEVDNTLVNLSINMVLPESRVQGLKTYQASGYFNYDSINAKGDLLQDLTGGLVVLKCSNVRKDLVPHIKGP